MDRRRLRRQVPQVAKNRHVQRKVPQVRKNRLHVKNNKLQVRLQARNNRLAQTRAPRGPNVKRSVTRSNEPRKKPKVPQVRNYRQARNQTRAPRGLNVKRSRERSDGPRKKPKIEDPKATEAELEIKDDYHTLLSLGNVALVSNVEKIECPVCFSDVDAGKGVTLHECLHSFCKECLAGAVQFSETVRVKCPFMNDNYSCDSNLQEREVKSLVTPEMYDRHLQRSMSLAESQAPDSFHCKTPDCPGWCLVEGGNVNTFLCPVCEHTNCLNCAQIHEGKNCRQYQDDVEFMSDSNEKVRKTREYLQGQLKNGRAMRCPRCQVIIVKNSGCDGMNCSMCLTAICWVTKGPRWGPGGRGDITGGCKCRVKGKKCHPRCRNCH